MVEYFGGLPAIPINCIVYQKIPLTGSMSAPKQAMYYRDNGTGEWLLYSDGLPNVIVNDIEIHDASGKLRRYIRPGVWKQTSSICTSPDVSQHAERKNHPLHRR